MKPYAVVKTGGKQYAVSEGDVIRVERIPEKQEGDTVELPVLAANGGEGLAVGEPELSGKVSATIVEENRSKKILVLKWRRRKQYRKKTGHRQSYHALRIDSIPAG